MWDFWVKDVRSPVLWELMEPNAGRRVPVRTALAVILWMGLVSAFRDSEEKNATREVDH